MHPKQRALLHGVLDAALAECLRSPVATLDAGHLRAVLVEHLLRSGASILERGSTSAEAKLLRQTDDVVRVERLSMDARPAARGARPPRRPDLRVWEPIPCGMDLHARSTLAGPDRAAPRALLDRFAALAEGTSDVLVLACDRRLYDAMRVERATTPGEPTVLSRLCARLLPPSASLGGEWTGSAPRLNGRDYGALAAITPMVFGAQRVVVALWPARRAGAPTTPAAQMDAFDA